MGNASFGMVGMDFETAVRENIPILVIVKNDNRLGGYQHHHPYASEHYSLNKQSGEYAKVAEALGGYAEKVTEPAEVLPALQRAKKAIQSGRATLLEVMTKEELEVPM
jgi:thiamine pyrophosphate-dependent acetolactate synthase large subunit-like protein